MGRTSLIMVMAFTTVLMMLGHRLSNVSETAFENYLTYYNRSTSHNIALSFANLGSMVIYRVPNAFPKWTNVSFGGGTASVESHTVMNGTAQNVQLMATSVYQGYYDTVTIVWGQSKFSKFAYYSAIEGSINWASKDTIYGPFHTQDKMTVNGSPVFWGKVTNKLGMVKNPSSSTPQFYGGYQTGIDIQMPSNYAPLKTAAQTGGRYLSGKDVFITFHPDSTMTIKIGTNPDTVVRLSTYAPNGAMVIDGGNVRVKGQFTGQLTLSAQANGVSNKGKVYFDSSLTYANNPLNGASNDLLGLCADDSLVITKNTNNSSGIDIQAALFSLTKGLGAEQYNTGSPRGMIRLLGGISQYQRAAVGTLDMSGNVATGYSKSYKYDNRLMVQSPPYYPTTGSYEILSWYER